MFHRLGLKGSSCSSGCRGGGVTGGDRDSSLIYLQLKQDYHP